LSETKVMKEPDIYMHTIEVNKGLILFVILR